jgi:hypothetical protein
MGGVLGALGIGRQAVTETTIDDFLGVPATSLFGVFNNLAIPAWCLLVLLPKWRTTQSLTLVPVYVYAVSYFAFLASFASREKLTMETFSSLAAVSSVMRNDLVLLAGWLHYLAFDLLVGRWIVRDSITSQVPHLLVVPCLCVTLMAGPVGWLLYQAVRRVVVG